MLNWLSAACVAQWVEHVNIAHLYFLSSALLVPIAYATFIIVTIVKDFCFYFYYFFFLLQYRFSILINLISLVTTTFCLRIRNTVLQLSPVISSVFKIWAATWDFQQCGILTRIGTSWLVGFVALRPKSTAIMVIAGRSVHLTTLFPGQAWTRG